MARQRYNLISRHLLPWCLWVISLAAQAGAYDPAIRWQVIETPHFEIIYDQDQVDLAREYAREAERAHATLKGIFPELPQSRTPILIADVTDGANGMATFLPYAQIIVFPVLPNVLDSITHYGVWSRELLVHEYAHILTFLPANGIYTPLRYVFGSIIRPNAILPRWYLEGLAVEIESRYSAYGRVRSPSTSAQLRALVRDGKLKEEDLAKINESSIETYPWGQRPYLFGSLIWQELTAKFEPKIIADLLSRHGRRLPFLLNAPLEKTAGKDWTSLWNQLRSDLTDRANAQLAEIIEDTVKTKAIGGEGVQHSPAISPDGKKLLFVADTFFGGTEIRLIERPGRESFSLYTPKTLLRGRGFLRPAWSADGHGFFYEQVGELDRFRVGRDLYYYDFTTQKSQQVTKAERALEATMSPSGKILVYVRIFPGRTSLWQRGWPDGSSEELYRAPQGLRISRPEFINDREIVFSGRSRDGQERLYRLSLDSKKPIAILPKLRSPVMARMTPKGLVVVAQNSGTNNLFLASRDLNSALALTDSATEVINADLDSFAEEIILTELTGDGRKLFSKAGIETQSLTPIKPLVGGSYPPVPKLLAQDLETSTKGTGFKERDYSPWRYLWPQYWIPFIYPVESGMLFQGTTGGTDPAQRHTWGLDASYDTVTNNLSYGVAYQNSTTPVDLTFNFAEANELLSASNADLSITQRFGGLSSSFFLPGLSNAWRGILGGSYRLTEVPSTSAGVFQIERAGPTAGVTYNSMAQAQFLSEHSLGYAVSLQHTEFVDAGNLYAYGRTQLSSGLRFRGPLPERHSVQLGVRAAYAPKLEIGLTPILGDRTLGANYLVTLINSSYLLRGYPSGALVGRSIYNASLEYSFPIADLARGHGLFPLFLRDLRGALFVDSTAVDGAYFDVDRLRYIRVLPERFFTGAGGELKLGTTAAYHLPLEFTLGLYYGFSETAGGGFTTFINIGYLGHRGVDQTPPIRRLQ